MVTFGEWCPDLLDNLLTFMGETSPSRCPPRPPCPGPARKRPTLLGSSHPVSFLPTQALGIIGSEAHPQTTLVRTAARGVARTARAAPSVLGHGSPQDYNGNSELWILLYQSAHLNIADSRISVIILSFIIYYIFIIEIKKRSSINIDNLKSLI